jgi:uncharacterized membrane protein YkvA (DUF1232 family)
LGKWKERAARLRTGVCVLYLSLKDPRTPWYAKAFLFLIIAYALSPIDLIPDFIPVLGYLDDLILVPAGVYLALKMVPAELLEEYRQRARTQPIAGKSGWLAVGIIICIWLLVIYLVIRLIWR